MVVMPSAEATDDAGLTPAPDPATWVGQTLSRRIGTASPRGPGDFAIA